MTLIAEWQKIRSKLAIDVLESMLLIIAILSGKLAVNNLLP